MSKTLSFAAVHFTVAFTVGYAMTGSVLVWVGLWRWSSRPSTPSPITFTNRCGRGLNRLSMTAPVTPCRKGNDNFLIMTFINQQE